MESLPVERAESGSDNQITSTSLPAQMVASEEKIEKITCVPFILFKNTLALPRDDRYCFERHAGHCGNILPEAGPSGCYSRAEAKVAEQATVPNSSLRQNPNQIAENNAPNTVLPTILITDVDNKTVEMYPPYYE